MVVTDYSGDEFLTLHEVSIVCHIPENTLQSFIEYEIIHPIKKENEIKLSVQQLKRIQKAQRLQKDLEVNLSGIAVILDLLEQMDDLQRQLKIFHRHYYL